jgi:hypothetical protein
MVNALITVALLLSAFVVATTFARERVGLALISRAMSWLTLAAAFVLPLVIMATYLAPRMMAPLNLRLNHLSPGNRLTETVPLDDRMLALACAAVPIAIAVWGLLTLRQLFEKFAAGEVFSEATSRILRQLSLALFAFVVAAFAAEGPISHLLVRAYPKPPYVFALSLGLEDLIALFAAAIAAVIARVMSEATRMADENAKFV